MGDLCDGLDSCPDPEHCIVCHEEPDTCDRCEKPGRIHVGHEQEFGYDGLCDSCLDVLAEGKQNGWPIP